MGWDGMGCGSSEGEAKQSGDARQGWADVLETLGAILFCAVASRMLGRRGRGG